MYTRNRNKKWALGPLPTFYLQTIPNNYFKAQQKAPLRGFLLMARIVTRNQAFINDKIRINLKALTPLRPTYRAKKSKIA